MGKNKVRNLNAISKKTAAELTETPFDVTHAAEVKALPLTVPAPVGMAAPAAPAKPAAKPVAPKAEAKPPVKPAAQKPEPAAKKGSSEKAPAAKAAEKLVEQEVAEEKAATEKAEEGGEKKAAKKVGGLTQNRRKVLALLAGSPEGMTRTAMAAETGIEKGWAKLLGAATKGTPEKGTMEGDGLVTSNNVEGVRGLVYTITAEGRKALAESKAAEVAEPAAE